MLLRRLTYTDCTDYYYDQLMTWACQMASPTIKTKLTHPQHTATDYYYDQLILGPAKWQAQQLRLNLHTLDLGPAKWQAQQLRLNLHTLDLGPAKWQAQQLRLNLHTLDILLLTTTTTN